MTEEKRVLGFIETDTEHQTMLSSFLRRVALTRAWRPAKNAEWVLTPARNKQRGKGGVCPKIPHASSIAHNLAAAPKSDHTTHHPTLTDVLMKYPG